VMASKFACQSLCLSCIELIATNNWRFGRWARPSAMT